MAKQASDRIRIPLILAVGAALLGLAAWFVVRNVEWKEERVWVGYHGEAQSNAFLAAQRLLVRLGHPVHAVEGLPLRDRLGNSDTLLLPRREIRLTKGQVEYLRNWVEGGGRLIAEGTFAEEPESTRENDPLFASFGARMVRSDLQGPKEKDFQDPKEFQKTLETFRHENGILDLRVFGVHCKVDVGPWETLIDETHGATASVSNSSGVKALEYRYGQGRAFLFTRLHCLDNGHLADEQHAEFLAALVKERPAGGAIWLVYQEQPPSLWAWLKDHAWMVLTALCVLVLAFLWRAFRRLGPRLPEGSLDRRNLLEHLAAAGRFQWAVREGEPLLLASQAAFRSRLHTLHPAVASLEPDEQAQALAEMSGLPESKVFKALRYHRHVDANDFTEAIQTLDLLRKLP